MIGLTIIESPYAGDVLENMTYLRRCILDSISRNEVPFASHGFFPHFLNDGIPRERKLGTELGYEYWKYAEQVVFYIDYGYSPGMEKALERLLRTGEVLSSSERSIGPNSHA